MTIEFKADGTVIKDGVVYDLVERKSAVKEPEWKILSMRNIKYKDRIWQVEKNKLSNGMVGQSKYSLEEWLASPDCEIYSVQYKDEVFTIGDKVLVRVGSWSNTNDGDGWKRQEITIERIKLFNFGPWENKPEIFLEGNMCSGSLSTSKKVKEKPVLFTSLDGVEIREGDRPWVYSGDEDRRIYQWVETGITDRAFKDLKLFSTYEAAIKYVDLHEKKYSKAEILNVLNQTLATAVPTNFSIKTIKEKLGL